MVIGRQHNARHQKKKCNAGIHSIVSHILLLQGVDHFIQKSRGSNADPDGIGKKAAHIRIVTFSRLKLILIKIENDSKACHEKERKNGPCSFRISLEMIDHTQDSHKKWKWQTKLAPINTIFPPFFQSAKF